MVLIYHLNLSVSLDDALGGLVSVDRTCYSGRWRFRDRLQVTCFTLQLNRKQITPERYLNNSIDADKPCLRCRSILISVISRNDRC